MENTKLFLQSLSEEMSLADLGDKRLSARLSAIVEAMSQNPAQSFPVGLGSDAALEATYRFLRNTNVTNDAIIAPHLMATVERCTKEQSFLVLHDTTIFQFPGEVCRKGLGQVGNNKHQRGFFGHFALAVSQNEPHIPLGVIGLEVFRRTKKKVYQNPWTAKKDPKRESLRWRKMVAAVEGRFKNQVTAIHVMDREADDYELYHQLLSQGQHFVNRLKHDRRLLFNKASKVSEVWQICSPVFEREIPLSRRSRSKRPQRKGECNPAREKRIAKLQFFAKRIRIQKPTTIHIPTPDYLTVNAVHVKEIDVPEGVEAVEWTLMTSEPIETVDEVMRVVDIYRARWIIEEYFKALKSGCAYEQRQMESYETLVNALAIFAPIAWRLLLLRSLSRDNPKTDSAEVLTSTEIEVLKAISKVKMPEKPTVCDAMQAIARLGGHIKSNGAPGWLVLWRGYQKLKNIELGWAARGERCDL